MTSRLDSLRNNGKKYLWQNNFHDHFFLNLCYTNVVSRADKCDKTLLWFDTKFAEVLCRNSDKRIR